MPVVACSNCGKPYPDQRTPFCCDCGGSFDYAVFPHYSSATQNASQGLGRYRSMLGLTENEQLVSLGEGNTPLIQTSLNNHEVFLKMESQNPTGSYKDRGTAVLVSFLKSRGVTFAVEDSSGNAGASFAGYCARAGIKAQVYVPDSASGPKRTQIEEYGAQLVEVPGPRSEAAKAVQQAAEKGAVYASHAWMPFGLCGIATIAYELYEQLGLVPGTVIAPVGHGGLLYGIMHGFESMFKSGAIKREPYYVGVQAQGCEPVADAFRRGSTKIREVNLFDTVAEGVKVSQPARAEAILQKLLDKRGRVVTIGETELKNAWRQSAHHGFFMEPTSALVWAALTNFPEDFKSPVVAVITGSGYKSNIPQKNGIM
jgi:threonine synthase